MPDETPTVPIPTTLLQQAWESYLRDVVPGGAPAVQIAECKRAFFGGAAAAMQLYCEIGEPHISEDAGVARLEGMLTELTAFKVAVVDGRA